MHNVFNLITYVDHNNISNDILGFATKTASHTSLLSLIEDMKNPLRGSMYNYLVY